MDIDKLDRELKNRFEEQKPEIPFQVEQKIDKALADLSELNGKKERRYSSAMTYWLSGVACALFAVIMLSYFQSNPNLGPASPENSSMENIFSYEEFSGEDSIDLANLLMDDFDYFGKSLENVRIIHSIKQDDRWIAMVRFDIEGFQQSFIKLIEIKGENGNYTADVIADSGNEVNQYDLYTHWYEDGEGVGFGVVNDFGEYNYVEKVVIETESGERLESVVYEDNYIYVSDSRPEKIEFQTSEGKVTQTMEAFNFDELYPLLAKEEGKLSLYVIGDPSYMELIDDGYFPIQSTLGTFELKGALTEYPSLEKLGYKEMPVYFLFDHKELIFHTNDFEAFSRYLDEEIN